MKKCNQGQKKKFKAPFYGWGSTASRLEPLRGGNLHFTTKFAEIVDIHFINLGRMKDRRNSFFLLGFVLFIGSWCKCHF